MRLPRWRNARCARSPFAEPHGGGSIKERGRDLEFLSAGVGRCRLVSSLVAAKLAAN
jgi:hypothetical protein